ncbi:tRNA dimethylallyltransferase [Marchantia polymorpha subsp. ruderalis]|uniref:tRNA dimethylallyltransferase n=1 Tax=Marchantia polymorpha TaxID=3197 RepID=A0A2R6XJ81_MARPO|nr:hypothetical protein MARPO_0012s0089 [Marchantia polymorpha]BBN18495.1 hypothetical protein Mp_8g02960 [Marchantia polymorpha subsp. ruderalis]|eukprot:PTQ46139.1 hypothetical protein MARPO_0012s0089 [Marchantia polymorpha]
MMLGGHAHCAMRPTIRATAAENSNSSKGRVIVITGPTAVGKSSAAISLAQRLNGEIISADSVQIYKGLDVGSAKIPWRERQNVPHHLLDIVHPTEEYSAQDFYVDAKAATDMVLAKGRVPIVVGGSGLYIRWFLNGKLGSPKPTEEQAAAVDAVVTLLQNARAGWDDAVKYLSRAGDPDTARRLARGDWNNLRRALEVIEITYRPQTSLPSPLFSATGCSNAPQLDYDFQCYFLYRERMDLYRRIDQRCEEMLTDLYGQGLMKEAMWLLELGILPNSSSPSKAIGYSQAMEFLLACRKSRGVTSVPQFLNFVQEFQRASRNYAERQLAWFRGEDIFHWVDGSIPENVVDIMEREYHTTSNGAAVSRSLESKARMCHKLKPLNTYAARNTIFTKPSACASILHWIEKTQGGVELLV